MENVVDDAISLVLEVQDLLVLPDVLTVLVALHTPAVLVVQSRSAPEETHDLRVVVVFVGVVVLLFLEIFACEVVLLSIAAQF